MMTDDELARIRADAERVAITRGIYEVHGPYHGDSASQYLQACIGTSLDVDAIVLLAEVERLRAELGRAEVRAEQFGQCLVAFVRKLTNRNWDGVYVCLPEVTRGGLMTSECRRCDSQEEALDVLAEHFGLDIRLN